MKFRNQEHKDRFYALLGQMTSQDDYHKSAAYLITLDEVLYKHVGEIYDFETRCINNQLIKAGWQTDTSVKTYRLLLNLWNGAYNDTHTKMSQTSMFFTPNEIFNSEYAPFYWEAIKLRFSWIDYIDEGIADD